MDLAEIEAFLVLFEELHFGRTAKRLHVTQPRVSRLIASMERQVGGVLFDRTSRRVAPTPLGVQLRARLAPAHAELTAALAAARTAARSPAGTLRVGFTATTAGEALDRLVAAFEQDRPDCSLLLEEVALTDSYTPLRSGGIDVLVCWLVLDDPAFTQGPVLARYPRVLAVADDHPLAREASVSSEVLGDYPVPNWEFRGLAEQVRKAMVPARTPSGRPVSTHPVPVRTVSEAAGLVARSQVVLPTVAMRHFTTDRIVYVPLNDLPPQPLGLVWYTAHENSRIRALAEVARRLGPLAGGCDGGSVGERGPVGSGER